ncbi:MAG: alkaline phosphatase family protein, partial [Stellaceae bacterium]
MDRIELNGRTYSLPRAPIAVICADGCDPSYLEAGFAKGVLPALARCRDQGFYALAEAAMPTFTNPNNVSIVTGAPPSVHGISGNFALDRATGAEIMMTEPELMRSDTILALMSQAGVSVAAVTAKDKLRRLLGHKVRGICFSSERADHCTVAEHGIDGVEAMVGRAAPDMYSADLSLSDYVQHGHAPDEAEALEFHQALDARVGRLVELGCVVAVTADHGMNDKALPDGAPHLILAEDVLNARFGAGAVRVICPITDPFVRHHGALGAFVRVYRKRDDVPLDALSAALRELPGVDLVLDRAAASDRWELPWDREADLVVTGDRNTVIGASAAEHDLSALAGHRLRSHGGAGELGVPFLLSRPLTPEHAAIAGSRRLRNFD